MLAMLERMRLACCVLPQGKTLNIRVLCLMLINLRMRFKQIAFVHKKIVQLG